jgi:hypothetical protein
MVSVAQGIPQTWAGTAAHAPDGQVSVINIFYGQVSVINIFYLQGENVPNLSWIFR